jgi:hypothetical protein
MNMESIIAFLEQLQALPLAVFIHKTPWAFTAIEVIHVFAVSLVIGTISIVDLRLLGIAFTTRPFVELSRQLLPFTWTFFVLAVIAGSLLFISRAADYFVNPVFWLKMALIAIAGINMIIFEFITVRSVESWNVSPTPPEPARLAGGFSITCWALVVILGRFIFFTLPIQ